jgi:hypothetical protein
MDPLVGALVLIFLALLGARFSFSTERVPQGPRLLFRTGTHFLLLGFLLGPSGVGLLSTRATAELSPFLALGMGGGGFHFGLQLDRASLARFPAAYHVVAYGQALLTFGVFLGAAHLLLTLLGPAEPPSPILLLGAAATACVTTPAGIAMVSSNFLVRGNVRDLLFFTASLDAAVGVVALQVVYALFRPETPEVMGGPGQLALVAAAAGLGVVMAIVFLWLVRRRPAGEELVLFVLGICAFAAGAALQWGLSPLFVSLTMGAVVANYGADRQRVFTLLQKWEKPVYLTFLLLAGALLRTPTPTVVLLALGYAVLRALAKGLAGAVVSTLPVGFPVPRRLGLGLIPQGGISLAMAVSGVLLYPELQLAGRGAEALLFTVIVIGVMLSELTGPLLTVQLLRRAGEISPQVEEALAEGDERRAEREAIRHSSPPTRTRDES